MRKAEINRKTNETDIALTLCIEGEGRCSVKTDCGFLGHMLELFSAHSGIDLTLECRGDSKVDFHHTVEDVGICIGQALKEALGDKRGITRYGTALIPMDEALVQAALDISGRAYCNFDVELPCQKIGDFDSELIPEFFAAISRSLGASVHIYSLYGSNTHHLAEAAFKAFARAVKQAAEITGDKIPSSKGVL